MAFELPLPQRLRKLGWHVKIHEKERLEPPHVTVLRRTQAWRIDLRTGAFMNSTPDPREIPKELVEHIKDKQRWETLGNKWDQMYPTNPVKGDPDGDEDQQ